MFYYNRIVSFAYSLFCAQLCIANTPPLAQQPAVNINLNIQTSASAPTSNVSTVTTSQNTTQQQKAAQEFVQQYLDGLYNRAQAKIADMPTLYDALKQQALEHKFSLIMSATFCFYSALFVRILIDKYYIHQSHLWMHWKAPTTLAELCAQPYDPLCKELMIAIQSKYMNSNDPTDFVTPLCRFLHDINSEEQHLRRFYRYSFYLSKVYLNKILPLSATTIAEVERLIDRLSFIRHLFISWVSNYKLQQVEKE